MAARKLNPASVISPLTAEVALRQVERVMQGREFDSIEAHNAFLAALCGSGLEKALAELPPLSPREQAQELADRAARAPTKAKAKALARQALAKDPDCVDALVVMAAVSSKTLEDAVVRLEYAVAAGERTLGPGCFRDHTGHFWGLIETRPYMRARFRLASLLLDVDRPEDAIKHMEALLELNPGDNQGVREQLLTSYLTHNQLDGARRLLAMYKDDGGAVFAWGRLLERVLSKRFDEAPAALARARRCNATVELYLTAAKRPPAEMPAFYSLGSEEEALICMTVLAEAWLAHPFAMMWLLAQRNSSPVARKRRPRGWSRKALAQLPRVAEPSPSAST